MTRLDEGHGCIFTRRMSIDDEDLDAVNCFEQANETFTARAIGQHVFWLNAYVKKKDMHQYPYVNSKPINNFLMPNDTSFPSCHQQFIPIFTPN